MNLENIREGLTCQVEGTIVVKMILFLKIVKSNNRMIDMFENLESLFQFIQNNVQLRLHFHIIRIIRNQINCPMLKHIFVAIIFIHKSAMPSVFVFSYFLQIFSAPSTTCIHISNIWRAVIYTFALSVLYCNFYMQ